MTEFWALPYGVRVAYPDSMLGKVEQYASMTGSEWAMEYDGDQMHFRFERVGAAILFCMACNGQTDFVLPPDSE
ncbi:hypothetical protein ACVIHC_002244 [Bradyrhizobium diazoefficiens]